MKPTRPAIDVARGASYLIIMNIAITAISLAAFAIIARLISREEMGGLAVLTLVSSGAQLLAGLGLGSTAIKFVSSSQATGDYEKMRQAGYECLTITGLGLMVLIVAIYSSADVLASSLLGSTSRATLLRLLTLEIGANGIGASLVSILYGLRKFKVISLSNMASFAVRQSLVVMFLELGWGLPGIVIGWGIGDSLNSLVLGGFTRKFLGPPKFGFGFVRLLKFSAPLFLGGAANYAWTWFDRALLLPFVSLAQLGSYNVAVTAFGALHSMPSSISGTLFPFYSHLYSDGSSDSQTAGLENAVRTASRYVSFLIIPVSVGLAVTALPAATLFAGNNYADAASPLAILSVSFAVACLGTALSQIFVVLGKTITSAIVTILSVLIPFFLGILLISNFGVLGAAMARGISLIVALVLSVLILRRILKVRFDLGAYRSAWLASLAMGVAVLALQFFFYSKYLLPVYIAVGSAVFVLSLRLLHALDREDIELISDFLKPYPRLGFVTRWFEKLLGV